MITPEKLAAIGSESAHQQALFCWANQNKEQHPCLEDMFAIPNGGYRYEGEAARLKAEGVKAGMPDIMLPAARWSGNFLDLYHGLFIEMKVNANKPSKEQEYRIQRLQAAGYCCIVVYSWSEAASKILQYLKGTLQNG